MSVEIIKSLGRDWFLVDWVKVWHAKGLRPQDVPGAIVESQNRATGEWPTRVHLSHLQLVGAELTRPSRVIAFADGAMDGLETLRTHQVLGTRYIRQRRGTLLADEMRVGKTGTITYAHDPDSGCMFVIGPLAARAVWHEWAARRYGWCRDAHCSICARVSPSGFGLGGAYDSFYSLEGRVIDEGVFDAKADMARASRVVFCHFAVIPTWRALFDQLKIGTLVVDEVHLPQSGMQNRKSLTSESIRFLNTVVDKAVFASGSPLWNKPKGLWPILDMLTPGAFGDFWTFARRYCAARPTGYGWQANGSSHEDELQIRLREVMLRRRWIDIRDSLPPINRNVEIVTIPEERQDQIAETAARIRSAGVNSQTVVGDLARLRKLFAKEKIAAAFTKARQALDDGHSVIVWAYHHEVANALAERLQCPVIHGEVDPGERELIIEAARSAAGTRPVALVASMATLATAVSLSFADVEIFAELTWNPDEIAQAEMRPFDGTRPIAAVFLVADCDVEQRLIDSLLEKLAVKDKLGIAPGVGSVADVLRSTLKIENARTLDMLADAVLAEAAL